MLAELHCYLKIPQTQCFPKYRPSNISATNEMPDYDSHGIEKIRINIGDMPGAKIDEHFNKVADLIGEV